MAEVMWPQVIALRKIAVFYQSLINFPSIHFVK